MPCAFPGCKENFKTKKGIKCEKCTQLFHRKCVKQPKNAQEFLCKQCQSCKSDSISSVSTDTSLSETSFLDFSDFENKISTLEEEVKSLRLIISLKDQEIQELRDTLTVKEGGTADTQRTADSQKTADRSWSQSKPKTHPPRRHSDGSQYRPQAVSTSNRFQPLESLQSEQPKVVHPREMSHQSQPVRRTSRKKKLLFLADSHGRYCAEKLNSELGQDYEVLTIFKPNAKINQVLEGVDKLTEDFTVDDVVVIQGGSNDVHCFSSSTGNDISAGTAKALSLSKKTKVIINSIPGRCDSQEMNHVVNRMNDVFQQTINQVTDKCSENILVNYPTLGMDRSCFSQYGVHLSKRGKDLYCRRLCELVRKAHQAQSFLRKKEGVQPVK